ncbi:MAG: nitrite/sulfite reductase [Candidatus Nanopelagicales bacterium]|nr:nitrite/sulfite reductase [Candidatus Nanopelagicales bacterium]MDZ4249512.1 nitrite/sulfite reductase [Candidatus Nanopelagicales bacterium]
MTALTSRKPRTEGQWALGQTDPLNDIERIKATGDPLAVRERVEQVYSRTGLRSIPLDDLRGRMRWWGLYTQRRPGIPAWKMGSVPLDELEDEVLLWRIRTDGGALTSEQARVLGGISQEFARDTADISDRQNIQFHWIRVEDTPEIWRRLDSVGLTTAGACGDTSRVVLGSPLAGVAADEIVDATPAIAEIARRFVGSEEFSNLPRKFKSAISGSPRGDVVHELNDISFVGVIHPDHGPGFDLWVGGGLAAAPKLAVRLGAWVPLAEVPEVWRAVTSVFRDYGYRRNRNRARMKFLVTEWGPDKFRAVLETEYLKRPLIDGPPPPQTATGQRDYVGVAPQRDGLFYVGAAPTVGRLSGTVLKRVADLAEEYGSGRIRLTVQQNLVILDVPGDRTADLSAELLRSGLRVDASGFRRLAMACTGIEYCKMAITETKARTAALLDELERRLPDVDVPIAIHVNGCPNSCARFQVADIGLRGVLVQDDAGHPAEGFQVTLGGSLGERSGFGRTPRGLRLAADDLPDYVDRVVTRYLTARGKNESFAEWTSRADEDALR